MCWGLLVNLLQPFCVDITALYHPDAIYSLTVPPCDSTIVYPGFDEIFLSRILGREICVRDVGNKVPSMLNEIDGTLMVHINTSSPFFKIHAVHT